MTLMPQATPVVINWDKSLLFQQYHTTDAFGRTICFYLTNHPGDKVNLPLVIYIQGSGATSVFQKNEQGHFCGLNYDIYLDPLKDRARLMLVEKPGVSLFDRGAGDGENWPREFLLEHTLERWTEAINAAITAAQLLPGVSNGKLLLIGHSEGAQVATHVAFTNPSVTHIARIAGNGPTQLFDLLLSAQSHCHNDAPGTAPNHAAITSTVAIEKMILRWKDIVEDKESITRFFAGHPYKRWYSFCSNSPMRDLLNCSAKVYMVHGTEDSSTPVVGFDLLQAELLAHNREFIAERLEGADHSINEVIDNEVVRARLPEVVERIIDWFFE